MRVLRIDKHKGEITDPYDYRDITILSGFGKQFTILHNKLYYLDRKSQRLCGEDTGVWNRMYNNRPDVFSLKCLIDL